MSLSRILAGYFSSTIQSRGRAYAHAGKVKNLRLQKDGSITADVRGSERYSVALIPLTLKAGHANLLGECDCPYAETDFCKHLWAMILEADQKSLSSAFGLVTKAELHSTWDKDLDAEEVDRKEDFPEEKPVTKKAPAKQEPRKIEGLAWVDFMNLMRASPARLLQGTSAGALYAFNERQIWFAIEASVQSNHPILCLRIFFREPVKNGRWSILKALPPSNFSSTGSDDAGEKILLDLQRDFDAFYERSGYTLELEKVSRRSPLQGFFIPIEQAPAVLSRISSAGRLTIRTSREKKPREEAIHFNTGVIYDIEGHIDEKDQDLYILSFHLHAEGQSQELENAIFLANGHFLLIGRVLSSCVNQNQVLQNVLSHRIMKSGIVIEKAKIHSFLDQYQYLPDTPPLKLPPQLNLESRVPEPLALLCLFPDASPDYVAAELCFIYPFGQINWFELRQHWLVVKKGIQYSRSQMQEDFYYQQLIGSPGFLLHPLISSPQARKIGLIPRKILSELVESLESSGWEIRAEGRQVHVLRDFETIVEGTIDWLDVSVAAVFDGKKYKLPEILSQKSASRNFVQLGSGTLAILPEKWLKQIELLHAAGRLVDGVWRFPQQKAILIDALLRDQAIVNKSEFFMDIRRRLQNLEERQELTPAPGFQGDLRSYQREGLAWLSFLKDLGLGGCLADDMGLGKTIQVLALLWNYYEEAETRGKPSLIVVPRSLVGNWLKEAQTFCPRLRFVDRSQGTRNWSSLNGNTVYITTYGVLRQDIGDISGQSFAFAVLDESQTVKNASSLIAKAVRTLRADHRLALSGTPIENHLGELASLFGFLNPGLLESGSIKEVLQRGVQADDPRLEFIKKALSPLFLRRKKEQVLKDLPPKIEQTIECDMEPEQARHYQELLAHYRLQIIPGLKEESWRSSSFIILEALLRLRQAACHPGLVDPSYAECPSSKIEMMVERLIEVVATGHKALVFSQFTSLLKILAKRLEKESMAFEYLDGQSRKREASVDRFQNDPKIPVFLISLKAGGVGLNLTAADYCFILDPWWNPAAEAQAIDRAHRIHQTKTVFAYRLISKGTIEEKIQRLQADKRSLAEAVLDGDGSALQSLNLNAVRDLFA